MVMMRTLVDEISSALGAVDDWWQENQSYTLAECIRLNERKREAHFASDRWLDPVTTAYGIGQVRLRASQDHLLGAAHALLYPSKHSALVLARASLEASAYGYWILDPEITVEDRIVRGAQLLIRDNLELLKIFRSLPQDDLLSELINDIKSRVEDTYALTQVRGLTEIADAKSLARGLASATTLVGQLLVSETAGGDLGGVAYRLLSGSVHSVLMSLFLIDPSGTFGRLQPDEVQKEQPPFSLLFVVLALSGLGTGLIRLAEVNGWTNPSVLLRPAVKAGLGALGIDDDG